MSANGARPTVHEEETMKKSKARIIAPIMVMGAFAAWEATNSSPVSADDQKPKSPVAVSDLAKKRDRAALGRHDDRHRSAPGGR